MRKAGVIERITWWNISKFWKSYKILGLVFSRFDWLCSSVYNNISTQFLKWSFKLNVIVLRLIITSNSVIFCQSHLGLLLIFNNLLCILSLGIVKMTKPKQVYQNKKNTLVTTLIYARRVCCLLPPWQWPPTLSGTGTIAKRLASRATAC